MDTDFRRYKFEDELLLLQTVLEKLGLPKAPAHDAAMAISYADLFGMQTHGIECLFTYIDGVEHGRIKPSNAPEVLLETPISAVIDAHQGWGHSSAVYSMKFAIQKAKNAGIGIVCMKNANHYGIAGYYPYLAIQEDLIGFTITNTEGMMVPTGGLEPLLGSNPISCGIPADPYPFLLDMATTVVPGGKVALYRKKGLPLVEGWAIGRDGKVTTDPAEVQAAVSGKKHGGIAPIGGLGTVFGGHNGYGLSLMVELLTGCMTCSDCSNNIRRFDPYVDNNSEVFMAIDFGLFGDKRAIKDHVNKYLQTLRNSDPIDPNVPVMTHGEREFRHASFCKKNGVPILNSTYNMLCEVLREKWGLDVPSILSPINSDTFLCMQ